MKIFNIIDSLELNGGSTMFLEMTAAMKKYWVNDDVYPYVVSKTGKFGRRGYVNSKLAASYGVKLDVCNYQTFENDISSKIYDSIVFHHFLGYTKNITFNESCKYIVIVHSGINLQRLLKFNPYKIICVSNYFANKLRKNSKKLGRELSPVVILNGCEDYIDVEASYLNKKFVIGSCQRFVADKFSDAKIRDKRIIEYLIGPIRIDKKLLSENVKLFGQLFDLNDKLSIIRSFDLYLHRASKKEGCSMAILEALSCGVPVVVKNVGGGIRDVIKAGINGFFYNNSKELRKIISKCINDQNYLLQLRKRSHEYFLQRFHVKHMLDNYKRLINES
jgi:glycosyltransferase involved in cell wall biosynthesis